MANRKEMFTSNIWKSGYIKVGRNHLKALFSKDEEQNQLARVLLTVQTFAFFSEGQVCTREGIYICRPGEWITSYTELSGLLNMHRHSVRDRLKQLESTGILIVQNLEYFKRIILINYESQFQQKGTRPSPPPLVAAAEQGAEESIFATANRFYSQQKELKGELV